MGSTTLEITLLLLLIAANGLFSMAEMAVVSSRKARLRQRAEDGGKGAAVALELAEDPNDFLSTVQIGITMIGTLAGAFGGATLAEKLGAHLNTFPIVDNHGESIAITVVVLAITYLSLILGELVPKNIALAHPESIASFVSQPMRTLSRFGSPVVAILTLSTRAVMFFFPAKARDEAPVTEEEIKVLIAQGTEHGTFNEAEQEMVEGVFRLGDRSVAELMKSRLKVVWLDVDDDWAVNERIVLESVYSRFPVAKGNLDQLLGVADMRRIFAATRNGGPVDLAGHTRKPLYVLESTPAIKALQILQEARDSLAFVIDEHGGVEGIVTLTDLMQAVVGDLTTADAGLRPAAVQREDGTWLVDGILSIRDLRDAIGLRALPFEVRGFNTVAGLVLAQLNHIPAVGEHFTLGQWRFEVADLDGKRIDKVLIAKVPSEAA